VPGLAVVGPDEEYSMAVRGIRVDRDYRNSLVQRCVDLRLHRRGIRYGNQDAVGVRSDGLVKCLRLRRGLIKSRDRGLPVRKAQIIGDEVIGLFVGVTLASRQHSEGCKYGKQSR